MIDGGIVPDIPGFSDLQILNAGGAGVVYSAHDSRHGRDVAIKVLTGQALDASIRESFARELNAMGRLSDHPHIVSVYESGFTRNTNTPFLVMPLFAGGSYADKLNYDGPLPPSVLVDVAIKILSALETAHQRNILHRDIKPENIFVGPYENQPMLGDFGISTLTNSGKTTTKAIAYTLTYAAPEVLNGDKQTKSSDIYSLGATLRTLLTGSPPFSSENTTALITQILTGVPTPLPTTTPTALVDLLDQMIVRDPATRPSSCLHLAQQLQSLQQTPTPLFVQTPQSQLAPNAPTLQPPNNRPAENLVPADERPNASSRTAAPNLLVDHDPPAPTGTSAPKATTPQLRTPGHQPPGGGWAAPAAPTRVEPRTQLADPQPRFPSIRLPQSIALIAAIAGVLTIFVAGAIYLDTRPEVAQSSDETQNGAAPNNEAEVAKSNSRSEPTELHTLTGHVGGSWSVNFDPDGDTVAVAGRNGDIKVWDITTGEELYTIAGRGERLYGITFSPDRTTFAISDVHDPLRIRDTTTGDEIHTLAESGSHSAIRFSPDGTKLAADGRGHTVKIWDTTTGQQLQTLTGHTDSISSMRFSPDNATLASGDSGGTIKMWDITTGQEIHTTAGHTGWIRDLRFSPDGSRLATRNSRDGTAKIWDTTTGQELHTLTGHGNILLRALFNPDGTTLATTSEDGTAKIWDTTTGQELHTLTGHTGGLIDAAFSPDGTTLATTSEDGTAKIWDTTTGQELHTLTGHIGSVWRVAFSPDASVLVTGGEDGTVKIWSLS